MSFICDAGHIWQVLEELWNILLHYQHLWFSSTTLKSCTYFLHWPEFNSEKKIRKHNDISQNSTTKEECKCDTSSTFLDSVHRAFILSFLCFCFRVDIVPVKLVTSKQQMTLHFVAKWRETTSHQSCLSQACRQGESMLITQCVPENWSAPLWFKYLLPFFHTRFEFSLAASTCTSRHYS